MYRVLELTIGSCCGLVACSLVPLPCLRAPGRGVPGFLAGPALVGLFLLLLFIHDPNQIYQITLGLSARYGQVCPAVADGCPLLVVSIFTRMSHVSQCKKGFAPIRELCTDFLPLINQ